MRLKKELASRLGACLTSWKPLWVLSLMLLVQLSGYSTTATEDNDTTNTLVAVVSVESVRGDFTLQPEGTDLLSDVCAANEDNPPCSVFNDNIIVTFAAFPKDATRLSGPANDIVFDRYRVTYTRGDGRNVPGADVPHPFDGVSTFLVRADGIDITRSFIVVRHQAKLESPLREITLNPNRKIFEARKRETAALGAGEKLVLGHPLAATIGDSARCMQNLEKVLFTGPKTSDTVTFICD